MVPALNVSSRLVDWKSVGAEREKKREREMCVREERDEAPYLLQNPGWC